MKQLSLFWVDRSLQNRANGSSDQSEHLDDDKMNMCLHRRFQDKICWLFCTNPRFRVPLVRPVGKTGQASPTLDCGISQNNQQKCLISNIQVLQGCRRCSTKGNLNLWPRKADRGKTSHRVPLEHDFEGAEEGPAWEHGQVDEEVQIPQRDLLFLG